MAKGIYGGVSSKARKGKKAYVGVNNKARKVKKAYIGDANGKAKLCYSAFNGLFGISCMSNLSHTTYNGTNVSTSTHSYNDQKANVSIVYCNGYFWGLLHQGSSNVSNKLYYSPDFVSWTQASMSGWSITETVTDADGNLRADNRYLYIKVSPYQLVVYDTQTLTLKSWIEQSGNLYLRSFAVISDGKLLLSWGTSQEYYTIYDATTNTQSNRISIGRRVFFPTHATSEDRLIVLTQAVSYGDSDGVGYFKNNAFTFGSVSYNAFNIDYNGIVYGNGKFTTGYATSTDGLTWSTTLDGQNRAVMGFGGGLFIRLYGTSTLDLQISEDGINWTTLYTGVANVAPTYGNTRYISVGFKPI